MKIQELGEFGLIDKLNRILPINDQDVIVGYGDDCACVKVGSEFLLFTVDIQVEGSHFLKEKINPKDLGWKLSTSNVSDIVSCGGKPRWALISLALPKDLNYEFIKGVYEGIKEAQDYYGFFTIGGNVSSSKQLMIDMSMVGQTDRFIGRDKAKAGEYVYISSNLGLSKAGLELILMNKDSYEEFEKQLIQKHYKPKARIDLLEKVKLSSSCIDVSDSLVSDLRHISEKSKVKIVIEKEKLPIDERLKMFCQKYNKDPYEYIFYSGEEYELALTSDKDLDLIKIGYVEEGEGVYLKTQGKVQKLDNRGFRHF
ncbi:thiamine-phosphate kinase [Sulfurihydrogenibium subterraneum]|uniref:thiamine-phosphate kinase n=1 Tax=Sulfurihydrogenibium subterraneum TaxID=171121 RepID=UPI00048C9606|nr:thiamine-phosphate kinase [Sulfurihydrogenibium subterraneum]